MAKSSASKRAGTSPARLPRMDVTYSLFRSFQTCPRKCYWQYVQQIESAKRSDALDVGTMFHTLMDGKEPELPAFQSDRDLENQAKAQAMHTAFYNSFGHDMDSAYTNVATEVPFTLPLRTSNGGQSRSYTLTGKIDGVVKNIHTGEHWLVEHKTASTVDGAYLDKLTMDLQIMIYMMAARKVFMQPVVGVIYNIVQKPSIRRLGITKTRTEPETIEAYKDRMDAQYEANPSMVSQHMFHFTNRDLDDISVELGMWADHLTACRHTNQWPRNTGQCHTVYGTCPFLPLCQGNMMEADIYMGTLYQRKEGMHSELEGNNGNGTNDISNDMNDIDNMVF